jgi:hypothetical protein
MIEEITQHPHFKERVEYVEYLFEQAPLSKKKIK